jgi:hypothetical protein
MPIRAFKDLPRNLVEWGRFFQNTSVTPDDGSVGEDQLKDGEVTFRKIQNITPDRLLGRDTSPAGEVQELQVVGGLEFTGTGIQRSALTGAVTAAAGSNDTAFRDLSACSVLGRTSNTAGTPDDIAAASNGQYLRRTGDALAFGAIADGDVPATIARDAEVTASISSAISTHEAAADPHPGYTTAAELTSALNALSLASGTYTPTLTSVANLDATAAYVCQYLRVGSVVTVSGRIDVDPTAATTTQVGISLPIASNFANTNECGGVAFCLGVAGQGACIYADAANDRVTMEWITADTSARGMFFSFTYRII